MADQTEEISPQVVRLWGVWKTVRKMCFDRGYELLEDELNIPLSEFCAKFAPSGEVDRKSLNFSLRPSEAMVAKYTDPANASRADAPPPPIGTVWVEFNGDPNMGIKQIRQFAQHIDQHNFFTGIMVTAVPTTPAAKKIGATIAPRILELFQEQDLLVNVTEHELVPKHIMLSIEEKRELLRRYRLKESQLPRIQQHDPVARYLGLRRGQVVKIIRLSSTAGRYASYRWCL